MTDEKPENLENAIGYQATVVEFGGKRYNATIYPLDGPCSTPLEWEMPKKHPLGLAAATVARKTNWAMNGKAEKLNLDTQPSSPTYPIKDGDLVWVAIDGKVYDIPLRIVMNQGKGIRAVPTEAAFITEAGGKQRGVTIGDFVTGEERVNVRIYCHADCSYDVGAAVEEVSTAQEDEEEVWTDAHLAEDLEDMIDTSRHEKPE